MNTILTKYGHYDAAGWGIPDNWREATDWEKKEIQSKNYIHYVDAWLGVDDNGKATVISIVPKSYKDTKAIIHALECERSRQKGTNYKLTPREVAIRIREIDPEYLKWFYTDEEWEQEILRATRIHEEKLKLKKLKYF